MLKLAIPVLFLLAASAVLGQECKNPYSPPKASFSVCIPERFTTPFPAAEGTLTFVLDDPSTRKHRLSITFRELGVRDSAQEAANTLIAGLAPERTGGKLIEEVDFNTASGIVGKKVIAQFDHRDFSRPDAVTPMVHIYYSFQTGEALLSFMGILFPGDTDGVEIVDSIARTAVVKH